MARKAVDPEVLRKEALGTALTTIERKFGKGSIMRLDDEASHSIPFIPTGSIGLDMALGIGGVPRGRVIEIYGPESSGKPLWPCTSSQKHRKRAATPHSSMPNTHSTPATPNVWASKPTSC